MAKLTKRVVDAERPGAGERFIGMTTSPGSGFGYILPEESPTSFNTRLGAVAGERGGSLSACTES